MLIGEDPVVDRADDAPHSAIAKGHVVANHYWFVINVMYRTAPLQSGDLSREDDRSLLGRLAMSENWLGTNFCKWRWEDRLWLNPGCRTVHHNAQVQGRGSATIGGNVFTTKRNSLLLKLLGATVVFLSAVSQQFQYDRAKGDMAKLDGAIRDQALIEKSALTHQTSMYVLAGDVAVPERASLAAQHANFAARKLYQALVPFVTSVRGIDAATKEKDLATLRYAARSVTDVHALSDFMKLHGEVSEKYEPAFRAQLDDIRSRQAIWRAVYTSLYLLGGFFLFTAGVLDWWLADAAPNGRHEPPRAVLKSPKRRH